MKQYRLPPGAEPAEIRLRLPRDTRELYQELAHKAGVSLNYWLLERLNESTGTTTTTEGRSALTEPPTGS